MTTGHLEVFQFEDIESILDSMTIYPIYMPPEYKEYEECLNMLFGGGDDVQLSYTLNQWGANLKSIFPMIVDVCLDEGSRKGVTPWLYLVSNDIDIDFLKLQLKDLFKRATKRLIEAKNKKIPKTERTSLTDGDIERLIKPMLDGLDRISYGEALQVDEIVNKSRLIEGIVIYKLVSLGNIPIKLQIPKTKEIITKQLRFYSAYENNKHVAISEWFTNNSEAKKPRMHSFILSSTIVNKQNKKILCVQISRRTWINDPLPRDNKKGFKSSLYCFDGNRYVTRFTIQLNKKTKNFEFCNEVDSIVFNQKYKDVDLDSIFTNPLEYRNMSSFYTFGIPYNVQTSDETVKRGVALIERQAFKNIFEESLYFKPVDRLPLIKQNSFVKTSKGDISTLVDYSSIKNFNLQLWAKESVFETLCQMIEEDILEFRFKEIESPSNSLDTEIVNFTYYPSEKVLKKEESKRPRAIKDEKKVLLQDTISNLIRLKNSTEKSNIQIVCNDEYSNNIFKLHLCLEESTVCNYQGDEDIVSIIKAFTNGIFSNSKVLNRDTDKCVIECSFINNKLPITITRHDNTRFSSKIINKKYMQTSMVINECIEEVNKYIEEAGDTTYDRTAAIIELTNYNGVSTDPKDMIRYNFGQFGIKTQFVTPVEKGLVHRLYSCVSDTFLKEGIYKYIEGLDSYDIYTYLEKTIQIDAKHTYIRHDPDDTRKKLRFNIPILARLSTNGLEFKILNSKNTWHSSSDIYREINEFVKDFISEPRKTKETRKCDIRYVYREISNKSSENFKKVLIINDLYMKDYGELQMCTKYEEEINELSLKNNINLIVRSSDSITPGYLTYDKNDRMGMNVGYSVLKDCDSRINDIGYIVPDKLPTTMKVNLAKTIFDKEELYHQRRLVEIRRFGHMEIEEATELYKELQKMVPAFDNMTSYDSLTHYLNKITEYLDSVEYNYSHLTDLICNSIE